jgi:hypothetical protein
MALLNEMGASHQDALQGNHGRYGRFGGVLSGPAAIPSIAN